MIRRTIQQAADMAGARACLNRSASISDDASGPDSTDWLNQTIQGYSTDSRTVEPGMLYIPLIGARADGHSFIEQVKAKGAAAALWQKDHTPYPQDLPLLLVDDTLKGMQDLAAAYLRQIDPYTIGITGSNGKTSTKDMTASIFAQQGKTQKTQGNHNNEIGLPMTILDLDEDTQYAILEMGMEDFGEIAELCAIAPLDTALIVSIGSAHMETLGSKDGIARAKMEIVQGLKPGGLLIWNADSPELQKIMAIQPLPAGRKSVSFGKEGRYAPVSAVSYTSDGIRVQTNCFKEPLDIHAIGDYQAGNALAAAAAALAAGLNEEQIRKGLQTVQLTKMRSALYPARAARILDDTYKSNPESAQSALETLMKIPGRLHIAVLADMLDLGETTQELHALIGRLAKEAGVDALYAYGPLSQQTAEAFGGRHYLDKEALIADLKPYLDEDAVILIKGSRAMKMDEVAQRLLEECKDE